MSFFSAIFGQNSTPLPQGDVPRHAFIQNLKNTDWVRLSSEQEQKDFISVVDQTLEDLESVTSESARLAVINAVKYIDRERLEADPIAKLNEQPMSDDQAAIVSDIILKEALYKNGAPLSMAHLINNFGLE